MDESTNGWMVCRRLHCCLVDGDRPMDESIDGGVDGERQFTLDLWARFRRSDRVSILGYFDGQMDESMNGGMDGRIDVWMDGWMDTRRNQLVGVWMMNE